MPETKVTASEIKNGITRMRQGGDVNDWSAPGTTNFEIQRADIAIQDGNVNSANGTVTVTYPMPYDDKPHLMLSVNSSEAGTTVRKITETNTGFTCIVEKPGLSLGIVNFAAVSNAKISWQAKGRMS